MHGVQITQLRAFLAVARLGSFTKAAEELGYSEPAVHLQVTALRRVLGGALFERQRGQMRPTRLGLRLLPHAERAIEAIDQLVSEAQDRDDEVQSLVIGVGRSSGSYVMPAIAGLFRQAYPAVDVTVRMFPVEDIIDQLLDGVIDIGFSGGLDAGVARQRRRHPRVVAVPWSRYGWALIASPAFLGERGEHWDGSLTVYLPAFADALKPQLVTGLAPLGIIPQFQTVENSEGAKTAASARLGVACIPVYAARLELAAGELVQCLEEVRFGRTFIEFAHRRPAENPMVATFVGFLRDLRGHPSIRQILLLAPQAGTKGRRARPAPGAEAAPEPALLTAVP